MAWKRDQCSVGKRRGGGGLGANWTGENWGEQYGRNADAFRRGTLQSLFFNQETNLHKCSILANNVASCFDVDCLVSKLIVMFIFLKT